MTLSLGLQRLKGFSGWKPLGPKQKLQIMNLAGAPVWTRQDFHWCSMILLGLPFIRARKATWVKIDVYTSFGEPDEGKHISSVCSLVPLL